MNILFRLYQLSQLALSWRLINIIGLMLIIIISLLSFYFLQATDLYNFSTVLLTIITCVLLMLTMIKTFGGVFIVGSILSVLSYIYIFPRILSSQFVPRKIPFPFTAEISLDQLNEGYSYIVLGIITIIAGAYLADELMRYFKKNKNIYNYLIKTGVDCRPKKIIITFLIFFFVSYFVSNIYGYNIFSTNPEVRSSKILGIISALFIPGVAAYLSFLMLFKLDFNKQGVGKYIALLIFIYILYGVLAGSRSGPLQIIFMIFSVMITLYDNFKIKITKYIQFILLIIISSIISFHIGSIMRHDIMIENNQNYAIAVKKSESKEAVLVNNENILKIDFSKTQIEILRRLFSQLDIAILGIVIERDLELSDRIVNLEYLIKSGINLLVPGEIYKDANLNSSLAWPFIYKFRDNIYLENKYYYETFPWSIWTISYVMYGWLLGLVGLFFIGFIISALYNLTKKNDEKGFVLGIFIYNLFPFFFTNGIDDYIVTVGRFIVSGLCFLIIYNYVVSASMDKIKLLFKK